MSTFGKIFVTVVVLAIIGFGGWFAFGRKSADAPVAVAPTPTPTPVAQQQDTTGGVATRDNSDASLEQDMTSVDASISAVDSNGAETDKSFNDKPVAQTE